MYRLLFLRGSSDEKLFLHSLSTISFTVPELNVLQVNKFYHPVVGGIEHVVTQVAEGLVEEGHHSAVLASVKRGFGEAYTHKGVAVQKSGSLGVALSTPIAPMFPSHLWRQARDRDILHYHLPNPVGVISHLLVRPDVPTAVTYHSDIVKQSNVLPAYRPFLELFLESVDRIITTSPQLRDHSEVLSQFREKVSVVPLAIDPDQIESDPPAKPQIAIPEHGQVLLFVGRLNYYKGVEYLLRAFSQVSAEATLLLIGDGERRDDIEELAVALDLGESVRFLGRVPDDVLNYCYHVADVFVLPSVEPSEAFGIVQLEAMAQGTPVVNTNLNSGVPWVSQGGQTGLTVPPRDSDALADAIESLLENADLRKRYGSNAITRVREKFTEDRMLEGILTEYHSLV